MLRRALDAVATVRLECAMASPRALRPWAFLGGAALEDARLGGRGRRQPSRGSNRTLGRRPDWAAGRLLTEPGVPATLSAVQLLTAVCLAGVLLPCPVTSSSLAREQGRSFALRLVGRQAVAATGFSALLAWGGAWL